MKFCINGRSKRSMSIWDLFIPDRNKVTRHFLGSGFFLFERMFGKHRMVYITYPNANDGAILLPPAKYRKSRYLLAASLIILIIVGGVSAGPIMSRVEQPKYKVTILDGPVEVREYGPMIAAEARVRGERKVAIQTGFRLIAAYIFGANRPNAKIAMTAPVQQQSVVKIAMTAPVMQQTTADGWIIRFIMPSGWTMQTLPEPNDTRVTQEHMAPKRVIVIQFSGLAHDALIQAKTDQLRSYARETKLKIVGEPLLAFYNPPWTLPFFRRNEIMFDLDETGNAS